MKIRKILFFIEAFFNLCKKFFSVFNKIFIYKYYLLKITTLVLASSILKWKTKNYPKQGLNVIQEAMNFSMTLYILSIIEASLLGLN